MKLKHALVCLCLLPVVSFAQVDQSIPYFIATTAAQYGISPQLALYVSYQESHWNIRPNDGDGHLICKKTGLPIRSRGLWQINNCSHPEVLDEVAYSLELSTIWAMNTFVQDGGCKQWSNCNR